MILQAVVNAALDSDISNITRMTTSISSKAVCNYKKNVWTTENWNLDQGNCISMFSNFGLLQN